MNSTYARTSTAHFRGLQKQAHVSQMPLTQDTVLRLKTAALFVFHGFKTAMATLLVVFVHQVCPQDGGSAAAASCTLRDNLTGLTTLNTIVVAFNALTLIVFMGMYILELYKENWCIANLQVDASLPNTNLQQELVAYPRLETRLISLNRHYCRYAVALVGLNVINIGLSCVILAQYFGGYKTLTGLLTNVFLVADKLYTCLHVSLLSMRLALPYSAYMSDHVIFNAVAQKHKPVFPIY